MAQVRRSKRQRVAVDYARLDESGFEDCVRVEYRRLANAVLKWPQTVEAVYDEDGEPLTVAVLQPQELSQYVHSTGFRNPCVVRATENPTVALGLRLPQVELSVPYLAKLLGYDRQIETIDVATQAEGPTYTMDEWVSYFTSPEPKSPLLNVVSLDLADTQLQNMVCAPSLVREMDLVEKAWPRTRSTTTPKVQLYGIMSVAGCFMDFHLDFGGSSVWYHVISGKKIFLVVPPTKGNLMLFEEWSSSDRQASVFFADRATGGQKLELSAGDTLLLPGGWPHCVVTPVDSVVIGGNFLTGYNLAKQLDVWQMEERLKVRRKFRFPFYKQLMWHTASCYLRILKEEGSEESRISTWERDGLPRLAKCLKMWIQSRDRGEAPQEIFNPPALLKELENHLKIAGAEAEEPVPSPTKPRPTWATQEEESSEEEAEPMQDTDDEDFNATASDSDEDTDVSESDSDEDYGRRPARRRKVPEPKSVGRSNNPRGYAAVSQQRSPPSMRKNTNTKPNVNSKANTTVRERLLKKIGIDPRMPLPTPKPRPRQPVVPSDDESDDEELSPSPPPRTRAQLPVRPTAGPPAPSLSPGIGLRAAPAISPAAILRAAQVVSPSVAVRPASMSLEATRPATGVPAGMQPTIISTALPATMQLQTPATPAQFLSLGMTVQPMATTATQFLSPGVTATPRLISPGMPGPAAPAAQFLLPGVAVTGMAVPSNVVRFVSPVMNVPPTAAADTSFLSLGTGVSSTGTAVSQFPQAVARQSQLPVITSSAMPSQQASLQLPVNMALSTNAPSVNQTLRPTVSESAENIEVLNQEDMRKAVELEDKSSVIKDQKDENASPKTCEGQIENSEKPMEIDEVKCDDRKKSTESNELLQTTQEGTPKAMETEEVAAKEEKLENNQLKSEEKADAEKTSEGDVKSEKEEQMKEGLASGETVVKKQIEEEMTEALPRDELKEESGKQSEEEEVTKPVVREESKPSDNEVAQMASTEEITKGVDEMKPSHEKEGERTLENETKSSVAERGIEGEVADEKPNEVVERGSDQEMKKGETEEVISSEVAAEKGEEEVKEAMTEEVKEGDETQKEKEMNAQEVRAQHVEKSEEVEMMKEKEVEKGNDEEMKKGGEAEKENEEIKVSSVEGVERASEEDDNKTKKEDDVDPMPMEIDAAKDDEQVEVKDEKQAAESVAADFAVALTAAAAAAENAESTAEDSVDKESIAEYSVVAGNKESAAEDSSVAGKMESTAEDSSVVAGNKESTAEDSVLQGSDPVE